MTNTDLFAMESGVLPSQHIAKAIDQGWVRCSDNVEPIPHDNIQPASLDLRLGNVAYRLRCSFLPDKTSVEEKLRRYQMGTIELNEHGAILEQGRPYLVPLVENLSLPDYVRAKANPKSSTGRLDVFTRVIVDNSFMFDEIPAGYKGQLYLEIVPRTFTIKIFPGLALNQLRLMIGQASLTDAAIKKLHACTPLLYRNGEPLRSEAIETGNGLFLGLHLGRPKGGEVIGYRAKENSNLIDLSKLSYYPPSVFWEEVLSESGARIVLHPEKFYLLLSQDSVLIPPEYAAEMTAYDPTSGELRTHYAGFFDPGFGFTRRHAPTGSRAALEVRAHDVPFAVEHGQNICKLSFERMIEAPNELYGDQIESNYQGQEIALGKHFKRGKRPSQPDALFG